MQITTHQIKDIKIAEIVSGDFLLKTPEDWLDLMGDLYYDGFDNMIVHIVNVSADFFDLKNGMAGEILQKFSNYRVGLAIVGDFSVYTSNSLKDFIFESNKSRRVNFVISTAEALDRFSGEK